MRFETVEIQNYRQYQSIKLTFAKKTEYDMHIIIASNGVGKTNILNAINWCLYGDEPHISGINRTGSNADSLPICNLTAIQDAKEHGEETCKTSVTIIASDGDTTYSYNRVAKFSSSTKLQIGLDDFEVKEITSDGNTLFHKEQEAADIVERYLPRKIRQYFYFDGEHLLTYFNPEKERISNIKDSIYEIAGVNTIHLVEDHLKYFSDDFQKQIAKLSPILQEKTDAMNSAQDIVTHLDSDIKALEISIEQSQNTIAQMDEILNGTEQATEANAKYDSNNKEIERIENQLTEQKKELNLFIRQYLVLIMLHNTNKQTSDYINKRQNQDNIDTEVNVNAIKHTIVQHKCSLCGQTITPEIEANLYSIINKLDRNASMQKLIEIKNDVNYSLDISDYQEKKQKLLDRMTELEDKKTSLEQENDRLFRIFNSVSNIDESKTAALRKKENIKLIKENQDKKSHFEVKLEDAKKELADAKSEYQEALAGNNKCNELRKKLEWTNKAINTIRAVKDTIVNDVKKQIQDETMDIFDRLIWKKGVYDHVELDNDFHLKLFHVSGESCLNSCSAAERELLALAFTIAIHHVSGYDNLLFIDTPVGRVSDLNRENFAKVLLDVSKNKEMMLSFTPDEYSAEVSDIMKPNIVSSFIELTQPNGINTEIK